MLPPSSDEENGATNDFGESFDFDGNYTLNGTFDDHLGTDKLDCSTKYSLFSTNMSE